jgi:hypothetical protein
MCERVLVENLAKLEFIWECSAKVFVCSNPLA